MNLNVLGLKHKQTSEFEYILDNIRNNNIQFIDLEENLQAQFQNLSGNQYFRNQNQNKKTLVYEVRNSNESMLSKFQNIYNVYYFNLILLIKNKEEESLALEIKNKLWNKFRQIDIANMLQYFQKNFGFEREIDLNNKKVVLFISKEQEAKNRINQVLNLPYNLNDEWFLMNTPQFNFQDSDQKDQIITQFQNIFLKYQTQISHFIFIIDQERTDITKKNFNDLFVKLRKFKTKIIVLLYNRCNEQMEDDLKLRHHFLNVAQIRNLYILNNDDLNNKQKLQMYFKDILSDNQTDDIGIDLKETIFQVADQEEQEDITQQFKQTDIQVQTQILNGLMQSIEQRKIQKENCLQIIENQRKLIEQIDKQIWDEQKQVRELEYNINVLDKKTSTFQNIKTQNATVILNEKTQDQKNQQESNEYFTLEKKYNELDSQRIKIEYEISGKKYQKNIKYLSQQESQLDKILIQMFDLKEQMNKLIPQQSATKYDIQNQNQNQNSYQTQNWSQNFTQQNQQQFQSSRKSKINS